VIIILKRHDLPEEYRDQAVDNLQLEHAGLSSDVINRADLIVFVEGQAVKFLKHKAGLQSKESFEVLLDYIARREPEQRAWSWSVKELQSKYKDRYKRKKN
jgi:hypothetical protein